MAVVNLATRYADTVSELYCQESIIKNITLDNSEISFDGSRDIVLQTVETMPLTDYTRSGTSRYGTAEEIGNTQQKLTMTEDKSYTGTIDKGNMKDNKAMERAGAKVLNQQMKRVVIPYMDKYALKKFAFDAGTIATCQSALTQDTIIEALSDADVAMSNAGVPATDRTLLIGHSLFAKARLNLMVSGSDSLATEAIKKGDAGELMGFKVRRVPDSYLPTGVQFIALHKEAALFAEKIQDAKVHSDAPGISGSLFEGRHYFGAFVRANKCEGVYVLCLSANALAAPSISLSGASATVTASSGASETWYTTDGSDPRYSITAKVYSSPVTLEKGQTIRVCCKADKKLTSSVAEKLYS